MLIPCRGPHNSADYRHFRKMQPWPPSRFLSAYLTWRFPTRFCPIAHGRQSQQQESARREGHLFRLLVVEAEEERNHRRTIGLSGDACVSTENRSNRFPYLGKQQAPSLSLTPDVHRECETRRLRRCLSLSVYGSVRLNGRRCLPSTQTKLLTPLH